MTNTEKYCTNKVNNMYPNPLTLPGTESIYKLMHEQVLTTSSIFLVECAI